MDYPAIESKVCELGICLSLNKFKPLSHSVSLFVSFLKYHAFIEEIESKHYDPLFDTCLHISWYFSESNALLEIIVRFITSVSGAPNGSVPQNICSYGISGWLARKGEQINLLFIQFWTIYVKCYVFFYKAI